MSKTSVVLGVVLSAWTCLIGCSSADDSRETDTEELSIEDQECAKGPLTLQLADCEEIIQFATVPAENVRAHVPTRFNLTLDAAGAAQVTIRSYSCARVSGLDGGPTSIMGSRVGVTIDSPDGTGLINIYGLYADTNNATLARRLSGFALPEHYDRRVSYKHTGANVAVHVPPGGASPYNVAATVTEPPPAGPEFVANWWRVTRRGLIKDSTAVPMLKIGENGPSTVTAPAGTPLAKILGATSTTSGGLFNRFAGATETVAVAP